MEHKLIAIVAMTENRVIGKDGTLPWNIPEDLKHFKRTTHGHTVIMGRKTHDSLGIPYLPGRRNIVISSDSEKITSLRSELSFKDGEDLQVVNSIENAILAARANTPIDKNIFFIGGASIYENVIYRCDEIIVSYISRIYDGDTFFPEIDEDFFSVSDVGGAQGNGPYFFVVKYIRN